MCDLILEMPCMQSWDYAGIGMVFPVRNKDDYCQMAVSLLVLVLPCPGAQFQMTPAVCHSMWSTTFWFQQLLTLTSGWFSASGVLSCSILDSLQCLQVSEDCLQSMGLSSLCNFLCWTNSDRWSTVKSKSCINFSFRLFCSRFQSWSDIIKDSVCPWIATLALHTWALLCFHFFSAVCLEMQWGWCVSFLCNKQHFSNLCIISLQLASSAWTSSTWIKCKVLQTLSDSRPAVINKFPLSSFQRVTKACKHKMNHYFLSLSVFISF